MLREPGRATDDRSSVSIVTLTYGAICLGLGLWIARAPLTILLDRFVPDDAFYYFNTARHFGATGVSTFDGIHVTNGYHPLWFLVSVPVFLIFPNGGETPIRVMLVLQALLAAGAAALMAREVARWFGSAIAMVAGLLWIVVMHRVLLNGLETALHTALFAIVFSFFVRYVTTNRGALALGICTGLLFLARTDAGFLIGTLGIWFLRAPGLKTRPPSRQRDLVAFAAPACAIAGMYLATNLVFTGHLMPVSGAAKIHHSDVSRAAMMAASGESRWQITLWNLWWPVRQHAWWAVASLVAPIAFAVIARMKNVDRRDHGIAVALQTWPFAVALWIAFTFYGVEFFGDHSAMLWYYPTLVLAGWFYLSALIVVMTRVTAVALPTWTIAWIVIGLVFGWLGRNLMWTTVTGIAAIAGSVIGEGGLDLQVWCKVRSKCLTYLLIAGGIAAPTLYVHGLNIAHDLRQPPSHWNYHLYRGAEWARESLPPSATIWSGSAGILGYFSGHRTVNTDGLANSYDFLEHVLIPGNLGPYLAQWDYAIDAMNSDALQRYFPDGCFVSLPPAFELPEFEDGGRRRLRVFQMKCRPTDAGRE